MERFDPTVMAMPPNVTPMPGIGPEAFLPPPPGTLEMQDAVLDGLMTTLRSQAKEEMQPIYEEWFRKEDWPKPDPASAFTDANRIFSEFGELHQRIHADREWLYGFRSAVFGDASPDERRHAQIDVSAKADFELMVSQLGSLEPTYLPVADQISDRDEAADKADFLYACDDDDEYHHAISVRGPWKMELARNALGDGYIVSQEKLILKAGRGEMPFRSTLIDPTTCAWVVENDRGICTFIRKYTCRVREAIASFDYDGKIRRKLKEGRDTNGKFVTKRQDHEECEIVEYWDRWWKLIWMDGELLCGPDEHFAGEPPYIVQVGALGRSGSASSAMPNRVEIEGRPGYFHVTSIGSGSELAQKGLSHVHLLRYPHQLREAIMNRALWAFRFAHNPAMVVEQDDIAAEQGVEPISRDPGALNVTLAGHEKIDQLPGSPDAASLGPLMQILGDSLAKTSMPLQAYGMSTDSNVSGFAVESLGESGRDKLTPHLLTIQAYRQQRAEKRLRMYGNFGFFTTQGTNDIGTLVVPRQKANPGSPAHFLLTPQMIRETSPRVRVKMNSLRIQNLPAVANTILQLRSAGLLTRHDALERYLSDPNPYRTMKELDLEAATGDPDSIESELLEFAIEQGELKTAAMLVKRLNQRKQPAQGLPTGAPAAIGMSNPMQGLAAPQGTGPQGPLGPRSQSPF